MMKGYEEKSKNYQAAAKNMNTVSVEYIQGIDVIKAFNRSASSYGKFRDAVKKNKSAMLDWYLSVCFSMTAAMEVLPSTMLFVLPTAMYLYINNGISIETLIMGVLLSYAAYKPLIKAMNHMDTIANIRVIGEEIQSIMQIQELERGNTNQIIKGSDVEFKGVNFSYDEKKKVLDEVSFVAKSGELTAIVGNSGGGKSTIAKLLAGFWNVDSGEILIGGADINQMPLAQNMDLLTYVSQDNFLYNKTILENLKVAKEDATFEEIVEVCKKANCHEFIINLEDGYETLVADAGDSLSGGERQRITIARALLKDSKIIVLDEATAYSDPDNEASIQKSINALVKNKTVIIIAHRLSTIVNANKIVLIDKGKVI